MGRIGVSQSGTPALTVSPCIHRCPAGELTCKQCTNPENYLFYDQVRLEQLGYRCIQPNPPRLQLHPSDLAGQLLATALQPVLASF